MPTAEQQRALQAEQQELAKINILQTMADYGRAGRTDFTTKHSVLYHDDPANKVSIGKNQTLEEAERQIHQERKVQNATTWVEHDFQCRQEEGAIAIKRLLEKIWGATGLDLKQTPFGDFVPPQRTIQVGLDQWGDPVYEDAPVDAFSLPLLDTTFHLDTWENEDQAEMLKVSAETKVHQQPAIEGFFRMVEDEVKANSIYRNQVLLYKSLRDGTYKLEFVSRIPDPIFTYALEVERRLTQSVWDIIQFNALYAADLQKTFKVLLYGPLGTGKTGAVITTEALAQQYGQTVIEYSPSGLPSTTDLARCMALAKRLGPTMVAIEDYEKFSSADLSGSQRSALTNLIDGADKRDQVSIIMTTNYATKIDEALLRGQRMTDAIEIGMLDAHGTEQLLRKQLKEQLDPDTDFEEVWRATTNFGPAFLKTTFTKALQVSIGENARQMGIDIRDLSATEISELAGQLNAKPIGTAGLVGAAESMHGPQGLYQSVVNAKAEKKPGFKEFARDGVVDFVKEHGGKFQLTRAGFTVTD
jgi:SpoVK/Ycf46/Vps4 family AAA+-type ATPase